MCECLMDGFSHQYKCTINFSESGHFPFKEKVLAPSLRVNVFNQTLHKFCKILHFMNCLCIVSEHLCMCTPFEMPQAHLPFSVQDAVHMDAKGTQLCKSILKSHC